MRDYFQRLAVGRVTIIKNQAIALIYLALMLSGCSAPSDNQPAVEDGMVDLSQWHEFDQLRADLSGQWWFFPFELIAPQSAKERFESLHNRIPIEVPDGWNQAIDSSRPPSSPDRESAFGYGSYLLKVSGVNSGLANLAISLPAIKSDYVLYIVEEQIKVNSRKNGQLPELVLKVTPISSSGKVTTSDPERLSRFLPVMRGLPSEISGTFYIVMQVSNYEHTQGGFRGPVVLGALETIRSDFYLKMLFVSVFLGMLLVISVNSFSVYKKRKQESVCLYLGVTALSAFVRMLSTESYLLMITPPSFDAMMRLNLYIEYCSLLWITAGGYSLCKSMFASQFSQLVERIIWRFVAVFSLAALFISSDQLRDLLLLIQVFCLSATCLIVMGIVSACRKGEPNGKEALAIFSMILFAVINDLLFTYEIVIFNAFIIPQVFCVGLYFHSLLVSKRMNQAVVISNNLSRNLNKEIDAATSLLQKRNDEIFESHKKLVELITLDGMTGLRNRHYFNEFLDKEWERSKSSHSTLSLIMIDIDHFKSINDSYGHLFGDACIKMVAGKIQACFKRDTDICARFGGEEFVVAVAGLGRDESIMLGEKVRVMIQDEAIRFDAVQVAVTISVGVSSCNPDESMTSQQLLGQADHALYVAKSSGRNRLCYEGNE